MILITALSNIMALTLFFSGCVSLCFRLIYPYELIFLFCLLILYWYYFVLKIEEKVESQFVHWEDDSIREILEDEIASKVFPRKPEHFTEFGSLDVKPNVEELIENINPFTCNELEIKSEESKDYYNDNTEFYNDDYDNIHAGAFNCNR